MSSNEMPKWVSLFFSENVYHQQLQKEKTSPFESNVIKLSI